MEINIKVFFSLLIAVAATSLGAAYMAQYHYDLQPCVLCLYQRAPFVVIACISAIGLCIPPKHTAFTRFLIYICSVSFLIGVLIAFYHTGVERHWWASFLEGCKIDFSAASPENLLQTIENTKAARCDEIPWADPILSLSMANYNAGFSLFWSVTTAIYAARYKSLRAI